MYVLTDLKLSHHSEIGTIIILILLGEEGEAEENKWNVPKIMWQERSGAKIRTHIVWFQSSESESLHSA